MEVRRFEMTSLLVWGNPFTAFLESALTALSSSAPQCLYMAFLSNHPRDLKSEKTKFSEVIIFSGVDSITSLVWGDGARGVLWLPFDHTGLDDASGTCRRAWFDWILLGHSCSVGIAPLTCLLLRAQIIIGLECLQT